MAAPSPTPATILGADLHRWFKADGTLWQDSGRTTPATADGDPVGAWDDASGNAGHAVQAASGARPTLKTAIVNGKPVLRGDGVDDRLFAPVSADASKTIWVVARYSGVAVTSAVLGSHGTSHESQLYHNSAGTWRYYSPDTDFGGTPSSWSRICLRYASAASLDVYIGNVLAGSLDPHDDFSTGTTMTLLGGPVGGSLFTGDVAEVIVASAAVTAEQRSDIDAYLVAKYGL